MARSTASCWRVVGDASGLEHAVQHLPVVDLHHVLPGQAERVHRVGHHHAHLGVGFGTGGADRVGVELHELAEAAGAGLLVAEDIAGAIAAERLGQLVVVLGEIAGERRGEIVAQAHPLLVVVLQREHAGVGPVGVGQELAERLGVFEQRRFDRIEAVALIDPLDGRDHAVDGGDIGRRAVFKTARQARLDQRISVGHSEGFPNVRRS